MLVPSIDFLGGSAVQLRGGNPDDKLISDLGDPKLLFQKFAIAGRVALVDLDAALGNPSGDNSAIIADLIRSASNCQVIVGGGIRTLERAQFWLNLGASKIVVGTAATPEFLDQLPRERVIVALDSREGEVVVKGWTEGTGKLLKEKVDELKAFTSGFLFTFVEIEGKMTGIPKERICEINSFFVDAAESFDIIVAGGIRSSKEVGELDNLGVDSQVGYALHTGDVTIEDSICACIRGSELTPTVVVDESGVCLGLVYSSSYSIVEAVKNRQGIYHSRRRGLWVKGKESGNTQELLQISLDCDRDALKFVVKQHGSFCHRGCRTCFDVSATKNVDAPMKSWADKIQKSSTTGGYTWSLFKSNHLLTGKIREEANELCDAGTPSEAVEEFLDLMYFSLIKVFSSGATWDDVISSLKVRLGWVSHRVGKPPRE